MSPLEAEKIINAYGEALARDVGGGIARKLSWLPCSACRVRYAFYVYLEELILQEQLQQDASSQLQVTYLALNQFIADADADKINDIFSQMRSGSRISKENELIYSKFRIHAFSVDGLFEIISFINECHSKRDNRDWIIH
jgi:hypothetical protein